MDLEIAKRASRRREELGLGVHGRLVAALKRGLIFREDFDKVTASLKHSSERQFLSQGYVERLSDQELASVILERAGLKNCE